MLSYLLAISTFTAIYALLALGLNLMWGMTGMVNLGILGYYALGGYVSALVTVDLGYPLVVGVIIGTVAGGSFRRGHLRGHRQTARRLSRHRHSWLC